MSENNPISKEERRDKYFDVNEEDVLHEAYIILYDYGYSHEELIPLIHLITKTTNYEGHNLMRVAEGTTTTE